MQNISFEEFDRRLREHLISNAREIFIKSGLTNNITLAFELYQKVLAGENERQPVEVPVSARPPGSPLKKISLRERFFLPKCGDCSAEMIFRVPPKNDEGIAVQLVCANPECDTIYNSDKDLLWWTDHLESRR